MKITVDVPEMKCARCAATAPIQPRLLYFEGRVPEQFRALISAVVKERPEVTAVDDAGRKWPILVDEAPHGWVRGPNAAELCQKCGALWTEAGKAFLVPPPAPAEKPAITTDNAKAAAPAKKDSALPRVRYPVRPPIAKTAAPRKAKVAAPVKKVSAVAAPRYPVRPPAAAKMIAPSPAQRTGHPLPGPNVTRSAPMPAPKLVPLESNAVPKLL